MPIINNISKMIISQTKEKKKVNIKFFNYKALKKLNKRLISKDIIMKDKKKSKKQDLKVFIFIFLIIYIENNTFFT